MSAMHATLALELGLHDPRLRPGLRVYARNDAMWLLVPACMEPPLYAVQTYGPLRYAGSIPTDRLSCRELEEVLLQFDAA